MGPPCRSTTKSLFRFSTRTPIHLIAAGLALAPTRSWKANERRSTPTGTELPGNRHETYCLFRLGGGKDGELAKCLRDAVSALQLKRHYLGDLRESGGRMTFYVGWVVGDRGEVFDARLLQDIAELGIDLGIEPFRVEQK